MNAEETLLVLAFQDEEFGGLRVPLPGLSKADYDEARCLVAAGRTDAPAVQRLSEALQRGLGPQDEWGPGDDAALMTHLYVTKNEGWSE